MTPNTKENSSVMATQQLIYESVCPVTQQRHGNWGIEGGNRYDFARNVHFVPLVAAEIPYAAREFMVVFGGKEDEVFPVAVLGMKERQNCYVTEEGAWDAQYVPAFVRRYPFVFSQTEDKSKLTLCIDESWDGFNQEGRGERLFDDRGERTPFLERLLGFQQDYHRNFEQTKLYCKRLQELDLLDAKKADFELPSGEKLSFGPFKAVSRDKLNALSAKKLAELAMTGALEIVYAQMWSMSNLSTMLKRFAEQGEPQPA